MGPKHERTGKSDTYAGTEGHYLLPHHENQLKRLKKQHAFFLSNLPDGLIKTPLPSDGRQIRLLDAGCADGTWLLEVAHAFPQQNWSLHGVDITGSFFEHADKSGDKLDLHVHDTNKPFAEKSDWHDSFDIVHQRLFVWAIKSESWPEEVRNIAGAVKPGGWLQLVELEWVDKDSQAPHPLIAKLIALQTWTCAAHGMDLYVVDRLEKLVEAAGLTNIQSFEYDCGSGALAREDHWKDVSADMWTIDTFRHFERKMPEAGIPGVAKTADEFHEFLDELNRHMKVHGYAAKMRFVIAQKPQS